MTTGERDHAPSVAAPRPQTPAPNIPECTCDRDDDSWVGEGVEVPLCPYHEKMLRHLSWESLACIVIDYEAALRAESVAAPAPFATIRKAITDSYYDSRDGGGTMESAADLAATRVINLLSQAVALAAAPPALDAARSALRRIAYSQESDLSVYAEFAARVAKEAFGESAMQEEKL